MNREEASFILANIDRRVCDDELNEALDMAIKALDQEPCEMTAEEYRQRMIQAFHNADTDELIAVCVLPTEKEFKHLEWLLKNHYKKEPCGDAIDRSKAIMIASGYCHPANVAKELAKLPAVNPTKTGHWEQYGNSWEDKFKCSECGKEQPKILCGERIIGHWSDYCPNCGCRMVEPQESEDKE